MNKKNPKIISIVQRRPGNLGNMLDPPSVSDWEYTLIHGQFPYENKLFHPWTKNIKTDRGNWVSMCTKRRGGYIQCAMQGWFFGERATLKFSDQPSTG